MLRPYQDKRAGNRKRTVFDHKVLDRFGVL